MKTNKNIYFPYYSGNIKFTKVQGYVNIHDFISKQKNPIPRMLELFENIKHYDSIGDKAMKRKLKHKLFSFTPSVLINKGIKRKYDNIQQYTGLMQLDFDKIENKNIALDLKEYLFNNYEQIVCVYLSPSGLGVKALMRIKTPLSKDDYKASHKSITSDLGSIAYFDDATKNAMLPLFLSYDPDILYRDYSDCLSWDEQDFTQPNYVELNEVPNVDIDDSKMDYYEKKTTRIFVNKMRAISNNGHPQLRSACLILGSRSAAGYIHLDEAKSIAKTMVLENGYFKKDLQNYLSTANWAIEQGYKQPKYY